MNEQAIIKRANQLLDDPEYGHELTWERALYFAREEAKDAAKDAAKEREEKARKAALWAAYKQELRDAGVTSDAAMKALAPTDRDRFIDLPGLIAVGRIGFSSPEKEVAVKAAIRKLWLAIGYGEPDFRPETYTGQTYVKWGI